MTNYGRDWNQYTTPPFIERLLAGIEVDDETGCWIWTKSRSNGGYSRIFIHGQNVMIHRAAYELFRGEIPRSFVLDHICHSREETCIAGDDCIHRRCTNPQHLEIVSRRENSRRQHSFALRKTHCPHGHPYDEANTYVRPSGSRLCKKCNRERVSKLYHARMGAES